MVLLPTMDAYTGLRRGVDSRALALRDRRYRTYIPGTARGRGEVASVAQKRARRMSAAAGRAAVSARMKKYWAERRKARAKK